MMTTALTPEESYVIDGVTYAVTSYRGPYLQHNGHEGWDVQVEIGPIGQP
jgi:galactose mutarotase-like enzyme